MPAAKSLVRFGPFDFDSRSGELWKDGVRRSLQEQSIKLLKALSERPKELVTREELQSLLWPDTHVVSEHGLNAAIKRLRDALGDNADVPEYIDTIPKRGYRFIARIESLATETQREPPPPPPVRGWTAWHAAAALTIVVAIGGLAARHWKETSVSGGANLPPVPVPPKHVLTQVTYDSGWTTEPTVSPDGQLLAYASDRGGGGHFSIWVARPDGLTRRRLTNGPANDHEPTFSPDGSRLAFRSDRDGGGIYTIPAHTGGRAERLVAGGHEPRFSPDGRYIAFWTASDQTITCDPTANHVFVIPSSGGAPVDVTAPVNGGCWPVWAPDSRHLLVTARPKRDGPIRFLVLDLNGRTAGETGLGELAERSGFVTCIPRPILWTGDRLIFGVWREGPMNLWSTLLDPRTLRVGDTVEQITTGPEHQVSASLSSTGTLLLGSYSHRVGLWRVPVAANDGRVLGPARRLTEGVQLDRLPTVASDGSVAFKRAVGEEDGICLLDGKSGVQTMKVPSGPDLYSPSISPDGSKIAYGKANAIEVVNVTRTAGPESERVLAGTGAFAPEGWSHDSSKLLYDDFTSGNSQIFLLDLRTAARQLIAARQDHPLYQGRFSPDDRWIAFLEVDGVHERVWITRVPTSGSADPATWVSIVADDAYTDKPRWSPNGRLLYFLSDRDGFRCVWAQRIDPGRGRPVGKAFAVYHDHNVSLSISNVIVSNTGFDVVPGQLVFNMGERAGNIWTTTLDPKR